MSTSKYEYEQMQSQKVNHALDLIRVSLHNMTTLAKKDIHHWPAVREKETLILLEQAKDRIERAIAHLRMAAFLEPEVAAREISPASRMENFTFP